eukprot:500856-Alexandrium_andersonii.AAC.1
MERKTAFAHFAAFRAFTKTPREEGHKGLVVMGHVYDGALQSSMSRLHLQWQGLLDAKAEEGMHAGEAYMLWLTCWM